MILSFRSWFCSSACWAVAGLAFLTARADVQLAPLFGDGAVLQREQPVRIWGRADAGEKVTVDFGGASVSTQTSPDGRWWVELGPLAMSASGRDLRVTGKNQLVIRDVLVGDVWVCSGQSNMEFTVANARNGAQEVAAANEPLIRQVKIERKLAETPLEDFAATPWKKAEPGAVGYFTAVGYFFAREMVHATGVPVGLINCTWSGTSVEPWMSAPALASRPEFAVVQERWQADLAAYPQRRESYETKLAQWHRDEAQARTQGDKAHATFLKEHRQPRPPAGSPDNPYPGNPSQIYNGMVHPLRRAAIRGVLWYQGEANAVRAPEYTALFQACIRSWRDTFGQPELPFYWVQIANFQVETDWARLRETQAQALALPATGMAVAIDIGDPLDIHPVNKQEVGRRLSLIALAQLEHRKIEFSGPRFAGVELTGHAAVVCFTHAAGLHATGGTVEGLELAGADRVFHPAQGLIYGERLVVRAAAVPVPVAVRYAWAAAPSANLYNAADLPAAPFRSDAW